MGKNAFFGFAMLVLGVMFVALFIGSLGDAGITARAVKSEPVKVEIFSEFECPYSARFFQTSYLSMKAVYGEKVELVFRHFPLGFHQNARVAAEASECARDQGKFWEYHDLLFQNQKALDAVSLGGYALRLGLDSSKFDSCLSSGLKSSVIESDMRYAAVMGVQGTPTVFINGEKIVGSQLFSVFKEVIDRKLAGNLSVAQPAPVQQQEPSVVKSDRPVVELFVMSHCPYGTQIEKGIVPVMELLKDKADISIKFCDYAMHGKTELDEQLRQYCLQKDFGGVFLGYLKCFLEAGDSFGCVKRLGIDEAGLSKCVSDADLEYGVTAGFEDKSSWSGGRYPYFNVFKDEVAKYGVRGSPALVINGKVVKSSRDSASLLRVICSSFSSEPVECMTALSSESPSAGFGFSSGGSASGGCGA